MNRLTMGMLAGVGCIASSAMAGITVVEGRPAVIEAAEYYAAGSKGTLLAMHEADLIHRNVDQIIGAHSTCHGGQCTFDDDLEHFVTEHRKFKVVEERLAPRCGTDFSTLFADRIHHLRGCPVCSAVVRGCVTRTSIPVVGFDVQAVSTRLSPQIQIGNAWVSVEFRSGKHGRGFYGPSPASNGRCGIGPDVYYGDLRYGSRGHHGIRRPWRRGFSQVNSGGWTVQFGGRNCPVRWL